MRCGTVQLLAVGCLAGWILFMTGCPTGDIKDASQNLKDSTQRIKEAAGSLEDGLKGLDPLALNKLLNSNTELRDKLQTLTSRINGYNEGTGQLVLKDHQLKLIITSYNGAFRLSVKLDELIEPARDITLPRTDVSLNIDAAGKTLAAYKARNGGLFPGPSLKGLQILNRQFATDWEHVAYEAWSAADNFHRWYNEAFTQFITGQGSYPIGRPEIDLQSIVGQTGLHKLLITITPTTSPPWSIRGNLRYINSQNLPEEFDFFELGTDRADFRAWPVQTALPPIVEWLPVRSSDGK